MKDLKVLFRGATSHAQYWTSNLWLYPLTDKRRRSPQALARRNTDPNWSHWEWIRHRQYSSNPNLTWRRDQPLSNPECETETIPPIYKTQQKTNDDVTTRGLSGIRSTQYKSGATPLPTARTTDHSTHSCISQQRKHPSAPTTQLWQTGTDMGMATPYCNCKTPVGERG